MVWLKIFVKVEQVHELDEGDGVLMSSPQNYRADDTSPCVGDELGGANIVEVQNHPNCGVDGKAKTGMKGGLLEVHLA